MGHDSAVLRQFYIFSFSYIMIYIPSRVSGDIPFKPVYRNAVKNYARFPRFTVRKGKSSYRLYR